MNSQNISKNGKNSIFQTTQMVIGGMPSDLNVNAQNEVENSGSLTTNVKCSCSLSSDRALHAKSWVNYCPKCHRSGTLVFQKTRDCPEGMIRCTHCDADFCPVHGKEHKNKGAAYLKAA